MQAELEETSAEWPYCVSIICIVSLELLHASIRSDPPIQNPKPQAGFGALAFSNLSVWAHPLETSPHPIYFNGYTFMRNLT
jgi:hypothetical protein